jgi:cholesterol transport system auxiliary component
MNASGRFLSMNAVAAAVMLAGCVSFGTQEPQHYHVLNASPWSASAAGTPRSSALLVVPMVASSFYDTQEIAYSRAPDMRAYYVFHAWTERPSRRITDLLVTRLERGGLFKTVATAVSGVRADLLLHTQLTEFYHDATTAPGRVKITITAELTDPVRRGLLTRRVFDASAPTPSDDALGAVQAFGAAITVILDDMCAWVDASAPR